jgi:hypothetical protein
MGRHCSFPNGIESLERELKYVLCAGRMPFAERWLASRCRADGRHASSDVWTVYYDTPDRASLGEKVNSDYLKTKVRVRWYAEPGGGAAGDAFLEMKRRIGNRREKHRVLLPGAAGALARQPLDDDRWSALPRRLLAAGVGLDGLWRPVLLLVYRRARFVDAASGARVSCDRSIRAASVPRWALGAWRPGPLPVGVIEIKGRSDELPANLSAIVRLGGRLSSFSKYAAISAHVRAH